MLGESKYRDPWKVLSQHYNVLEELLIQSDNLHKHYVKNATTKKKKHREREERKVQEKITEYVKIPALSE